MEAMKFGILIILFLVLIHFFLEDLTKILKQVMQQVLEIFQSEDHKVLFFGVLSEVFGVVVISIRRYEAQIEYLIKPYKQS